jgi:hypothetical protein
VVVLSYLNCEGNQGGHARPGEPYLGHQRQIRVCTERSSLKSILGRVGLLTGFKELHLAELIIQSNNTGDFLETYIEPIFLWLLMGFKELLPADKPYPPMITWK